MAPSLPELSSGGPEALPRPYGVASAALLPGLSIVLPCFNESENLPDMVQDATVAAERVSAEYEIVIVDDGSRDGTAAVAAALEDVYEEIRLVIHLTNRGYGAAVRTGIAASSMPYVLLTDAPCSPLGRRGQPLLHRASRRSSSLSRQLPAGDALLQRNRV